MIGVDVVDMARFRRWLAGLGPEQWAQVFTPDELRAAGARRDRAPGLAARFAAKEAVLKILEGLDPFAFDWHEVEVVAQDTGAPAIRLCGAASHLAAERGIGEIAVSLSHSGSTAVAVAVALSTAKEAET